MENEYSAKYAKVNSIFCNRKLLTIQSLLGDLLVVEEALGFQFWLSDEIGELTKRHENEWKNLQKQVGHQLYDRNLHYLYSALELAYAGLCDPCYNNLRTVHESVIKMYFIWAFPASIESIHDDMEPVKKSEYGHESMIHRLYLKDTQESMRQQFRELSAKSHSNYTGIGPTLRYSVEQIKDCLWFIKTLSLYNITAEIENQSSEPSIIELFLVEKVGEYLEKLRKVLTFGTGNMATYFPDEPSLVSRLKIRIGN